MSVLLFFSTIISVGLTLFTPCSVGWRNAETVLCEKLLNGSKKHEFFFFVFPHDPQRRQTLENISFFLPFLQTRKKCFKSLPYDVNAVRNSTPTRKPIERKIHTAWNVLANNLLKTARGQTRRIIKAHIPRSP